MRESWILFDTKRAALPDNFNGEVDFVLRRPNAGAELDDHVLGMRAETINHFLDRIRGDAELGAFATGMHKADRRRFWIDDVNRATVCDVNAERDTQLIGDDAVAAGEFAAHRAAATAIDRCYFVSMNLFRSEQRPIAHTDCVANFPMGDLEPLQHFGFIV